LGAALLSAGREANLARGVDASAAAFVALFVAQEQGDALVDDAAHGLGALFAAAALGLDLALAVAGLDPLVLVGHEGAEAVDAETNAPEDPGHQRLGEAVGDQAEHEEGGVDDEVHAEVALEAAPLAPDPRVALGALVGELRALLIAQADGAARLAQRRGVDADLLRCGEEIFEGELAVVARAGRLLIDG